MFSDYTAIIMTLNSKQKIRIGTRGSRLAICQAIEVKEAILSACPEYSESNIEIIKIYTTTTI